MLYICSLCFKSRNRIVRMKYFWTSSGRDLVICFQHGVLIATHVKCALYQLANFTLTLIPKNTLWTIWYWRLNFHVHQSSFFYNVFCFFLVLYLKNLFIQCKLFFICISYQKIFFFSSLYFGCFSLFLRISFCFQFRIFN